MNKDLKKWNPFKFLRGAGRQSDADSAEGPLASISDLLGCLPASSYSTGEERVEEVSGQKSVAKPGNWLLRASPREPKTLTVRLPSFSTD